MPEAKAPNFAKGWIRRSLVVGCALVGFGLMANQPIGKWLKQETRIYSQRKAAAEAKVKSGNCVLSAKWRQTFRPAGNPMEKRAGRPERKTRDVSLEIYDIGRVRPYMQFVFTRLDGGKTVNMIHQGYWDREREWFAGSWAQENDAGACHGTWHLTPNNLERPTRFSGNVYDSSGRETHFVELVSE